MLNFVYITSVMYLDSDGRSPKWWQWMLFGIGAALVVAATVVVSIATFGTGAAFASMAGAIVVGAAKGALIGAAIGTVVGIGGGAIYSGVTGADMGDSILQGFLMGFGGGAIIGAVIGGAAGGISFSNAANSWHGGAKAMVSHFKDHGVKMGFKNPMKYTKAAKSVMSNGKLVVDAVGRNAYVSLIDGVKYKLVGVKGAKITTYHIHTYTKTMLKFLGLL